MDTTEIVNHPNIKPESSHVVRHGRTFTSPSCSQAFLFGGVKMQLIDLTGQRFGRLTVVKRSENNKNGDAQWVCECICGKISIVNGNNLRRHNTQSCGCYRLDIKTKHGESSKKAKISKEYAIWGSLKTRCSNENQDGFKNYGGRGITICDRWLYSFENFLADMGRCPKGLSIERNNNDGNYEPGNCRWATRKEQTRNMRTNVWIEHRGTKMIRADWMKKLNATGGNWHYQLQKGLTDEEVLKYFLNKQMYDA